MANVYKILGQSSPAATTETVLYTVPSATSTVCSSIIICNRGTAAVNFRVSLSQGGATPTANKDYIYYSLIIPANDTFIATIGISLATTDKVRVYASTANVSFNLFGEEI